MYIWVWNGVNDRLRNMCIQHDIYRYMIYVHQSAVVLQALEIRAKIGQRLVRHLQLIVMFTYAVGIPLSPAPGRKVVT